MKVRHSILLSSLLCFGVLVPVAARSTPVHQWSKRFGDGANQVARSVTFDPSGNAILVGWMEGTVDFGGGPLAAVGSFDAYIAKFDPSGAHLWSKRFGDSGQQQIFSVATDAAGDIAVIGIFNGNIDLGGGNLASASSNTDVFVGMFDANGTHLWSKSFGDIANDDCRSVAFDPSGNVIIGGFELGTIDFGGGPLVSAGAQDAYVAKFDATGTHLWSTLWGGSSDQGVQGVTTDSSGNIVLVGWFGGNLDLGGGPMVSAGGLDAFVARIDPSGAFQWNQNFGDTSDQKAVFVGTDSSDNVAVSGYFAGSIDLGGGTFASAGGNDVFAARFSPAGAHMWSHAYGTTAGEEVWGFDVHANGNVYLAGYSQGSIDFGGGPLPNGGAEDMFMVRLSPMGTHVWSKSFGYGSYQGAFGVAVDAAGDVLLGGQVGNAVNFGAGILASAGGFDATLAYFSDDVPIPVLFSDFRAVASATGVAVRWTLYNDEPMAGYTLYRSTGGAQPVAIVEGVMNPDVRSFVDTDVTPATTYRYELVVRTDAGTEFRSPVATVTTAAAMTSLGQNHPNPFNPATTIEYSLARRSPVAILIYDAAGALVVRLDEGVREAGAHRVDWNGRNAAGAPVGSGVYFYRIDGMPAAGAHKMVLLK